MLAYVVVVSVFGDPPLAVFGTSVSRAGRDFFIPASCNYGNRAAVQAGMGQCCSATAHGRGC